MLAPRVLCTNNETVAPLHVAILTVKRELYLHLGSLPYLCTNDLTSCAGFHTGFFIKGGGGKFHIHLVIVRRECGRLQAGVKTGFL